MSKRIEREIEKIYNRVFKQVMKKYSINKTINSSPTDLRKTISRLIDSKFYNEFAKKFSKELAKKGLAEQRGIWKKYFQAAKTSGRGVVHRTYTEFQQAQITKAVQHNFTMIKSIPKHILAVYEQKYIQTLKEQVLEGSVGRGAFEKELKKQGHKNSKLIARTETAKLHTIVMENRARDIGSSAYIWLSSNDIRTRKSHKDMKGVVVFWRNNDEEKPNLDNMFGNAGEFPNCRCTPTPIFNEKDLTQSSYKVYNYKTHRIITMNKQKLSQALKEGELK